MVRLEDTDHDGRYDKKTVFVDHLVAPRAVGLAGAVSAGDLSRDDAVLEVALAYRQFAHEHPELYKAFIRSASMKTTEHEAGYALSMQTLKKVLRAYRYPEVELIHLSRGLRSALHGFVSLEAAGFFQGDADVNESFTRMVRMFLDTLKQNEAKE